MIRPACEKIGQADTKIWASQRCRRVKDGCWERPRIGLLRWTGQFPVQPTCEPGLTRPYLCRMDQTTFSHMAAPLVARGGRARLCVAALVGGWLVCWPGLAAGQDEAVNAAAIAAFFQAAERTRVDVVGIGDSNQLQRSNGWDEGWHKALARRYGLYATGVTSWGENTGRSAGTGYGYECMPSRVNGGFVYANAPAEAEAYLNVSGELSPLNYLHVPAGTSVNTSSTVGFILRDDCPLRLSGEIRFRFSYGVFSGAGAGGFSPFFRYESFPFDTIGTTPFISTRTGDASAFRVASGSVTIPANALRTRGFAFRPAPGNGSVVGPFIGYYIRAENTARSSGAAMSTLYARGSQSFRDIALAFSRSSDETLSLFFESVRATQDGTGAVLVRLNSGLNDRSESLPSIPSGIMPGNSAAAYQDNLQYLMTRIRTIWANNGWPGDQLYFLLTPSHPVAWPDDAQLVAYRARAEAIAATNPRTCVVRLDRLTNAPEMLSNIWYQLNGYDRNHLTDDGYFALAERELLAIIRPSCVADFNSDGGIDGQDVEAFFGAWAVGDFLADVNGDGGVDGGDVERFVSRWAAGGC